MCTLRKKDEEKKKLVKAQDTERDAQYIGTKSVISPILKTLFFYFLIC